MGLKTRPFSNHKFLAIQIFYHVCYSVFQIKSGYIAAQSDILFFPLTAQIILYAALYVNLNLINS